MKTTALWLIAAASLSGQNSVNRLFTGPTGGTTRVSLMSYGCVGDGVADDSTCVQNAVNSANTKIYAPAGQYRLNSAINLTNRAATSLGGAKPLEIYGDGGTRYGYNSTYGSTSGGTVFICNTNSVCFDTTGSQHMVFRDLLICASTDCMNGSLTTPGKVGILMARSTASPYAQYNIVDDVAIYMEHIPAATGLGTIGLYNVAAEHMMGTRLDLIADSPAIIAATDRASFPSPFQGALAGPASMAVTEMNSSNFLSWEQAGLDLYDINAFSCDTCYFAKIGGTFWAAIRHTGNSANVKITGGQIEGYNGVMDFETGSISGLTLTPTIVSPNSTGLFLIAGVNTWDQPEISIASRGAGGTVQMVVQFSTLTINSGRIKLNSDADTPADKQQLNDTSTTLNKVFVQTNGGASDTITVNGASTYYTGGSGGGGGSVFTGSTATATTGITGTAAAPIISLSDQSVKSPIRFEITLTGSTPVTSVTINNKTAGAKFGIVWFQPASNMVNVTYGSSVVSNTTCAISQMASKWTEQFLEVASDGSTVYGVGCSSNDPTFITVQDNSGSVVNTNFNTLKMLTGTGITWTLTDLGSGVIGMQPNVGTIAPANGGTGVANGTNNMLTYTGNFTLGLTLSGNTAITLPTSGTICTTVSCVTTAGLGTGVGTWLATPSGANLASALTTPLTAAGGGTGVSSLGSGIATWLGTPSGANLASALTTALPNTKGGTGGDSSAQTGYAKVTSGAWSYPALSQTHALGCAIGDPAGSALATGILCYIVSPTACTIQSWDILVDSGTATVDVLKIASGTALPSASIAASALPAIASNTSIHSTTLTSWTTSVAQYDRIGFNLTTTSGPKYIYIGVNCDESK